MAPAQKKSSKTKANALRKAPMKRLRFKAKKAGTPVNPRKLSAIARKLRPSITPGTILILLSGAHKGKRVVFMKQTESGLLLVTGPFRVNGVPMKRVDQRYVIATSTKVSIEGVDASKFGDSYFGRTKKEKKEQRKRSKTEDESVFMQQGTEAKQLLPESRKNDQDVVDKALLTVLSKDKLMTQYLKTRFTLRNNMKPHAMKF